MAQLIPQGDVPTYVMPGGTTLLPAYSNGQTFVTTSTSGHRGLQTMMQLPMGSSVMGGPMSAPVTITVDANTGNVLSTQQMQPGQPAFLQQRSMSGSMKPAAQTVRQVPAFLPQQHGGQPMMQYQTSNVMDMGNNGRLLNPALANKGMQRGPAPMPARGMMPGLPVGVRPVAMNGSTTVAVRPANVRPIPGTAMYSAPNGNTLIRPPVRVPKLGTVATYNPATGMRSGPVGSTMVPGVQPMAAPRAIPAGLLQNVQKVQMLQQQRQQQTRTPPMQVPLSRVHGVSSAPSSRQPILMNRAGAPMGNHNQLVSISLPDGSTHTAVMDPATLARLLEGQNRNTVVKMPVPAGPQQQLMNMHSGGVPSMEQLGGLQAVQLNLGNQTSQHVSDQLLKAALGLDNMDYNHQPNPVDFGHQGSGHLQLSNLEAAALAAQLQQRKSFSGGDESLELASASSASPASPTGSNGQDKVGDLSSLSSSGSGSKDDLKNILTSIGAELVRHGISVEAAVAAGWLGVLAPGDLQILAEAFMEAGGSGSEAADDFNALNYGFFGDANPDAGAMGSEEADGLGDLLGGRNEWDSMADDLGLSAEYAPPMHSQALDSASEFEARNHNGRVKKADSYMQNGPSSAPAMLGKPYPGPFAGASSNAELAARFANLDLGCGFY